MKKIVSYSLFGDKPRYTVNSLINADLCAEYYPDWKCRIYYDSTVSNRVISELNKKSNVELVMSNGMGHARRMWRFLSYDDCDVFISRDIDSYITKREVSAVNEWLDSGKNLHVMRDHPHHKNKIQAGMFGLRKNDKLQQIKSLYDTFINSSNNHLSMDEVFLTDKIYNLYIQDMIVHDDKNFHSDKTNDWKESILYNDEYGQFIGRAQYPPSIHQEEFQKYERILR
jgi:hypothetical protein